MVCVCTCVRESSHPVIKLNAFLFLRGLGIVTYHHRYTQPLIRYGQADQ